jgi:hypothetical protein
VVGKHEGLTYDRFDTRVRAGGGRDGAVHGAAAQATRKQGTMALRQGRATGVRPARCPGPSATLL